jgi:hypothetical protein
MNSYRIDCSTGWTHLILLASPTMFVQLPCYLGSWSNMNCFLMQTISNALSLAVNLEYRTRRFVCVLAFILRALMLNVYCQDNESRHRNFLRWIPLFKSTSSLISQRKLTLHGARARETPEDLNERKIRQEIRTILPELFGGLDSNFF